MALVKEDGTIVAGANSYVTRAEADAYFTAKGNTVWVDDTDDEVKDAVLYRGMQALENLYRGRWRGVKTNNGVLPQVLAWPRKKEVDTTDPLVDSDGISIGINSIPPQLKQAQMEAALIELTQPVTPNILPNSAYLKRTRVDVIEQEFFDSKPSVPRYPLLDQILLGLAAAASPGLEVVIGLTEAEANQPDNSGFDPANYPNYFIVG